MLATAVLCGALLAQALGAGAQTSKAGTSRWWKLACGEPGRPRTAETTACTFTVKLRGDIDGSRLHLVRQARQRHTTIQRRLQQPVAFHVDVDSQGGEIFAALEIGRILRAEGAALTVGTGASCISACVFLLMGAVERHISEKARVGIHRPSLRASPAQGRQHGSEPAIVAALSEQLVGYAQEMHVPRAIIDALMAIPPDRIRFLSPAELATYGMSRVDVVALAERRARSSALPPSRAAPQSSR